MPRKKKKVNELPKHYQALEAIKSRRLSDYRPAPIYASIGEAKQLIRERYEKRGIEIKKITRYDKWWFHAIFKEPYHGLTYVRTNWPYINGARTWDEAQQFLRRDVNKILEENTKEKKKKRCVRKVTRKSK